MSESMVELVARAIYEESILGRHRMSIYEIKDAVDSGWRVSEKKARTAIAAMRSPTEDMLSAFRGLNRIRDTAAHAERSWQHMIDVALK